MIMDHLVLPASTDRITSACNSAPADDMHTKQCIDPTAKAGPLTFCRSCYSGPGTSLHAPCASPSRADAKARHNAAPSATLRQEVLECFAPAVRLCYAWWRLPADHQPLLTTSTNHTCSTPLKRNLLQAIRMRGNNANADLKKHNNRGLQCLTFCRHCVRQSWNVLLQLSGSARPGGGSLLMTDNKHQPHTPTS
jgi:hypothetical protein